VFCQKVFQEVLSPRHFKRSRLQFPSHGVLPVAEVKEALAKATGIDGNIILRSLYVYRLCIPLPPQPLMLFCASHLRDEMLEWFWMKDSRFPYHLGIVLLNAHADICSSLDVAIDEDSRIWKRGIVIQRRHQVTVMVSYCSWYRCENRYWTSFGFIISLVTF